VAGYEGAYSVSDRLRVRSEERVALCRAGATRRVRERILAPVIRAGFVRVTLSCKGRTRGHYVHKLAREAFADGQGS
jgi:hypothetical protein